MGCFGTRGETGLHGKLEMVARSGTTCLDPQEGAGDVRDQTLVVAHMCAFGSRGLGVSTFPWGRVRRSRHLSFYDLKIEGG
ncbi:hypothetical protein CRG98_008483 [Punica granatum]|uniref:Uncharacterized protein n=1 Tax=Punica granatum TaxID=22663 RepID=A0A2I0KRJ9_PUNGR|nr:hypothetical protein CRG98_008483 [Punica granatum]